MQLRQSVTLGLLDQHDGSIRNVDADFDHRGAHQDLDRALLEALHHGFLLGRGKTAV